MVGKIVRVLFEPASGVKSQTPFQTSLLRCQKDITNLRG